MRRRAFARYAAPVAFLAAVTVAVLLIRSGLGGGDSSSGPAPVATAPTPAATTAPATTSAPTVPRRPAKRFYLIRSGDTLDLVAIRFDTTVERLLALNPGIEPTALTPGQKVRIR